MMRTIFFMTGIALAISCSLVVEAARAGGDGLLFDPPPSTEQEETMEQSSAVDIYPSGEDRITWSQVMENLSLPAPNAPTYLKIPTYDGSGQCVHPDIMFFPEGWNGYRYWMAMTPYPNGNDRYENPSIVVSNDNVNWTAPVKNPLDDTPPGSHNSDAEWIFVPDEDRVHLLYRMGDWELFMLSSPNGLEWNGDRVQVFNGAKTNCCLSPAVVREEKGLYRMWMVNGKGSPNTLMTYIKEGSPDSPWTFQENCIVENRPEGRDLWHIDVIRCVGGRFYLALVVLADMNKTINTTLHLGLSTDGVKWTISEREVISASRHAWDNDMIYRSSSVVLDGEKKDLLGIWYSARSSTGKWHIGYSEVKLNVTWISQNAKQTARPVLTPDSSTPRSYYNGSSYSGTGSLPMAGPFPEPPEDNPATRGSDDDGISDGPDIDTPAPSESGNSTTDDKEPEKKGDNSSSSPRSGDIPSNFSQPVGPDDASGCPVDLPQEDDGDLGSEDQNKTREEGDLDGTAADTMLLKIGKGKRGCPISGIVLLTVFLSLASISVFTPCAPGKRASMKAGLL